MSDQGVLDELSDRAEEPQMGPDAHFIVVEVKVRIVAPLPHQIKEVRIDAHHLDTVHDQNVRIRNGRRFELLVELPQRTTGGVKEEELLEVPLDAC